MNRFRAVHTLTALLLIVCVAVAGAGKYGEKTLIGTWEFDMVKMYTQVMEKTGQELPPGMSIDAMLKDNYMRITFLKGGEFTFESKTMGGLVIDKGTWEIVEAKDDQVTVKTINEKEEEQVVTMVFKDADNFESVMSEGDMEMTMYGTRAKVSKNKDKKSE